jgi:hypothetical protein
MANYTETLEYKHEVLANGVVQVRTTTVTLKDGVRIGEAHHRHALAPGDDLTNETAVTKGIAQAAWTPEVVAAYQAQQAAAAAERLGNAEG